MKRAPKYKLKKDRGFTLVELLIVMVIMALMLGLVAGSLTRSISGSEMRTAARKMAASMRYTRTQAILKKEEQVFVVNTEEKTYQAPGREEVVLPEGMEVLLTTARSEMLADEAGGIRFFPDGGSTGGHVELTYNGREYRVNVAWLTGDATLARPQSVR